MRILKKASYILIALCIISCSSDPLIIDYQEVLALNDNIEFEIQTGIDLPISYSITTRKTNFLFLTNTTYSLVVSIANDGSIENPNTFLDTHIERLSYLVKNELSNYEHFDNIVINITENDEIFIEMREEI